jgi:RNA polymerase sigma-70 factor, ECF subfamily
VVADVVQETFIEAARSAASFDQSRGALSSWLVGIAHHRVAAHWRQAARTARLQKLVEQRADEIRHWLDAAAPVGQPSERQELAEFAELVRATLAELPADYAALLTAKYVDDRELVALAADTGSSVDAVKSKLARARRDFRAKFERLTREPTQSMIE